MPRTTVPIDDRLVASLLAVALAMLTGAVDAPVRPQADDVVVQRVAGADRVATAVELSSEAFDRADTAVLATAATFADALAGAPLAAAVEGPLLLTGADALDARVEAELVRLGVDEVLLLGGERALSPEVLEAVDLGAREGLRLAGPDRFATAAAVADELVERLGAAPDEVVLAVGDAAVEARAWPDALAAGVYAGHAGLPVLLVTSDRVPAATRAAIGAIDPSRVTVAGGPAAIPDRVVAEAADGRAVTRAAGGDRFATATALADRARASGAGNDVVVLVSGAGFADALAGGSAAVALDGVLALADPVDLEGSPALLDWLDTTTPSRVLLAGGPAALSPGTDDQLRRTLQGYERPTLGLERLGGFDVPLDLAGAPGDDRRWVVERDGRVKVVTGDGQVRTALDITGQVGARDRDGRLVGEYGLLGIALHPDFAANGRLVLHHSSISGDTRVAEYRLADPLTIDPGSRRELYRLAQPASNHNGGTVAFGPDRQLHVFLGDGGGSGDRNGRAQDAGDPLGAVLRMDVDASTSGPAVPSTGNPFLAGGGDPFVWLTGVRNPYRSAFDTATGDLFVADVGQDAWEEVTHLPAGTGAGANLGWNVAEGDNCYPPGRTCDRSGFVAPILEYGHAEGRSITGGHVHRGDVGMLRGHYFYGDFVTGFVRSFRMQDGRAVDRTDWTAELGWRGNVHSFGRDGAGNTYVMDSSTVHRIVER